MPDKTHTPTPTRSQLLPAAPVPGLDDRLLRACDVAQLLAVSVRGVWRLAATGRLPPPVKVGGLTRWRDSEIRRFIADPAGRLTRASPAPSGVDESAD